VGDNLRVTPSEDDLRAWDSVADRYAELIGTPQDSFWRRLSPFLTRWMPPPGSRVLDLGCGHGWLADLLTRSELDVVGVDGSEVLIDQARQRRPDLQFEVHDLTAGLPASIHGTFDLVVSHMVLMDMPTISTLLRDTTKVLSPGGVMVSTFLHPSFFRQQPVYEPFRHRQVTGYLEHEQWWVDSFGGHRHYHRPLSWYVRQFATAGMTIVDLDEPETLPHHDRPRTEWSEDEAWFATVPTMLSLATVAKGSQ
jgi:SAM-dependent methyltransferase